MSKKIKIGKLIPIIVLGSFIIPIIYLLVLIVFTNIKKTELIMKLLECLIGVFAFFLPNILERKLKVSFHPIIYISYIVFLYASVFLGEYKDFYFLIPHWDTYLHFFSASMLGIVGFSIVYLMNDRSENLELSPFFIAIFSFVFAISIGTVWEITEYLIDLIFKTNMQKFVLENGEILIGQLALKDTMEDLIIDLCGALIGAMIGYISLIKKNKWVNNLLRKSEITWKQK